MAPTPPLPVTEDTPPDMLAGSMDLHVVLPSGRAVKMSVERGTPMMDLLVQVATANKIPPGGHVIQAVGERGLLPYKPSTPIGALDTWTIQIVPKSRPASSTGSKKGSSNNQQPFEQTFRLQVHLPRNQLFVTRVSPKTLLSDVLTLACSEKNLDPSKYELRHPANLEERLRSDWTLADYKLQEVTMVAKRGRPLGAGLSSSDIMALQKEEEKRRQQTRAGGSTGSAVLGLMFNKRSQSSVCDGSVSSDSLGGRSISPIQSDDTSPPGSSMPPPRPARKRRPAPKPPGPPPAVISHSRNSSDSSGYHEASVLSESPESNGINTSPSGTLPRRSKLTSAAPTPAPPTTLSRSLSNLATVNGGGSRSVSHSVSTSSLASSGPGKKKKAAPPPPPIARPPSREPVQPQRTLSLSTLSSQSSVDNGEIAAVERKRLDEVKAPSPDVSSQTSVDTSSIKSSPERQIVEPIPEKKIVENGPMSLPVLPTVELENVNNLLNKEQPPVTAPVATAPDVVPVPTPKPRLTSTDSPRVPPVPRPRRTPLSVSSPNSGNSRRKSGRSQSSSSEFGSIGRTFGVGKTMIMLTSTDTAEGLESDPAVNTDDDSLSLADCDLQMFDKRRNSSGNDSLIESFPQEATFDSVSLTSSVFDSEHETSREGTWGRCSAVNKKQKPLDDLRAGSLRGLKQIPGDDPLTRWPPVEDLFSEMNLHGDTGLQVDADEIDKAFQSVTDELEAAILADELKQSSPLPDPPSPTTGSHSPSLSDWEYQLPAPPTAFQDRESPTPTLGETIALGETAVFAESLIQQEPVDLDPTETRLKNDINERLNQAQKVEVNEKKEANIIQKKISPRASVSKAEKVERLVENIAQETSRRNSVSKSEKIDRLEENIVQQQIAPRNSVSSIPENVNERLQENIALKTSSPRSSVSSIPNKIERMEENIVQQKISPRTSVSSMPDEINERPEERVTRQKVSPRSSVSSVPEKIVERLEESNVQQKSCISKLEKAERLEETVVQQTTSPRSSVSKPEQIEFNQRLEESLSISQTGKVHERLEGIKHYQDIPAGNNVSKQEEDDDSWKPQQVRADYESEAERKISRTEFVQPNQLKNFTITTYQRPRDTDTIFSEERKNLSELKKPLEATLSKHPLASTTSLPRTNSFSTGSSESVEHPTVRRSTSHISLVTPVAYREAKADNGHERLRKTASGIAASQGPEESSSRPATQEPLQSLQVMRSILNPSGQEPAKSESSIEQDSRRVDSESQSKQKEAPQPIVKTDSVPEQKNMESAVNRGNSQTESEVRRYSYRGPPAVNFTTWSERPKSQVSIKLDSDYRIGTGQGGNQEPRSNQEVQSGGDVPKPTTKVEPVPLSLRIVTSSNAKHSPSFSSQKQTDEKQTFKEPHQVIVRTSSYNTAQMVDPSRIPIVRAVELKKSFLQEQQQQQNVHLGWNGVEQPKQNSDKEELETFKGVNNLAKRFSFAAPTSDNVRVGFRGPSTRPVSAYLYGGESVDTTGSSDMKRNSTSTGALNAVGLPESNVGNATVNGAKKYTSVVGINGAGLSTPGFRESDVNRSHPKINNSASVKVNGFALPKQPMPVVKGFRFAPNGTNHSDSSLVTVSSLKTSEPVTVKVQRSDSYSHQNQRNLGADTQPTFNVRIQHTPVARVDSAPVKQTTVPVPPPAPVVAKKPLSARPKSFAAPEASPREQLMDAIRSFGGRNSLKQMDTS